LEVSQELPVTRIEAGQRQATTIAVVREGLVRLHVNGYELATLMCSPCELDLLVLGFLRSEEMIAGLADVRLLKVCPSETCVEVWLRRGDWEPPARAIRTSGCGGGITFTDLSAAARPLVSELRVTPRQLGRLMTAMLSTQQKHGIHTSALADGESLLAVAEDVGRHNTIDKLWGRCMVEGIATQDRILLCTGRISSEMLLKAARMGVPIVTSRTTPTSLAVALAEAWNVTLAGYVRRDSLNVYTAQERVVEDGKERTDANS
jgi:FdhD protein